MPSPKQTSHGSNSIISRTTEACFVSSSRRRESKEKIFRPTGTIPETVAMALVTSRRASLKKADLTQIELGSDFTSVTYQNFLTLGKALPSLHLGRRATSSSPRLCWEQCLAERARPASSQQPHGLLCSTVHFNFPPTKWGLLPASQAAVSGGSTCRVLRASAG